MQSCTVKDKGMDTKTKLTDLLGGATRGKTRVRGFAPWNSKPGSDRMVLVEKVLKVIEEYREHLPLTVRQIFYRLIGATVKKKRTLFQTQLYETLNRARRAKLILMSDITDGGTTSMGGGGWSGRGVEKFLGSVVSRAKYLLGSIANTGKNNGWSSGARLPVWSISYGVPRMTTRLRCSPAAGSIR